MLDSICKLPAVIKILLVLMVLLSSVGCVDNLAHPPVSQSINLAQRGVVAHFDFEIKRHRVYFFGIRFDFDSKDRKERARIKSIIGDAPFYSNHFPFVVVKEPGIETPVRLTITRRGQRDVVVYQKTVTPALTSFGADFFEKEIGYCDLTPGQYTASLESYAASPAYASIPTYLTVNTNNFKATYDMDNIDRSKSCPN